MVRRQQQEKHNNSFMKALMIAIVVAGVIGVFYTYGPQEVKDRVNQVIPKQFMPNGGGTTQAEEETIEINIIGLVAGVFVGSFILAFLTMYGYHWLRDRRLRNMSDKEFNDSLNAARALAKKADRALRANTDPAKARELRTALNQATQEETRHIYEVTRRAIIKNQEEVAAREAAKAKRRGKRFGLF